MQILVIPIRYLWILLLVFSSQSCGNPDSETQKPPLAAAPTITVTTMAGLVSLETQQAPLGALLTELGQRTHIVFTIPEAMKPEPLTISVYQRPVEEVLQQVLSGKSYSVQYRQEGDQKVIAAVDLSVPQEPVVGRASSRTQLTGLTSASQSPSRSTTTSDPKPPAARTDVQLLELEQSLRESQNPATRMAALNGIAGRETDEPVNPIVAQGLSDRAPEVREAALNLLKYSLDPVPLQSLASMATQDTNPVFRIQAMGLMIDQLAKDEQTQEDLDAVKGVLNRGLADPDPRVREQAAMLLENN